MLCQIDSQEALICPAKSTRGDSGAGYRTMAENITQFHELQCLPVQIDITSWDHGNGIEATLNEQEAKWHKACYLKVNKTELERIKKRKHKCTGNTESEATTSKKMFTRKSVSCEKSDCR